MQGVAGWEGGVNQGKELLANPTLHIEGEGWVEPGLWLFPILPPGWIIRQTELVLMLGTFVFPLHVLLFLFGLAHVHLDLFQALLAEL